MKFYLFLDHWDLDLIGVNPDKTARMVSAYLNFILILTYFYLEIKLKQLLYHYVVLFFQKLTQIWDKIFISLDKRTWTAHCIFATSSNNRLSQFLERTLKKELFSNFFVRIAVGVNLSLKKNVGTVDTFHTILIK